MPDAGSVWLNVMSWNVDEFAMPMDCVWSTIKSFYVSIFPFTSTSNHGFSLIEKLLLNGYAVYFLFNRVFICVLWSDKFDVDGYNHF